MSTLVDQMSLHYSRQKPNMQRQVRATFWNRRHLEWDALSETEEDLK